MVEKDTQTKDTINQIKIELAGIKSSVGYMTDSIRDLKEYVKTAVGDIVSKMEKNYVTQDQFEPIKRLVYGVVTLVLVAVVGGLMALILKR